MQLAGEIVDASWLEKLDGMIDYAASKGWLDENGRIRAHISMPDHREA